MKYRKKPVVVDAIQWTGKNTSAVRRFCPATVRVYDGRKISYLLIPALSGRHVVRKNDWIIRSAKGKLSPCKFYPCKPDIFEQTYEKVGS